MIRRWEQWVLGPELGYNRQAWESSELTESTGLQGDWNLRDPKLESLTSTETSAKGWVFCWEQEDLNKEPARFLPWVLQCQDQGKWTMRKQTMMTWLTRSLVEPMEEEPRSIWTCGSKEAESTVRASRDVQLEASKVHRMKPKALHDRYVVIKTD